MDQNRVFAKLEEKLNKGVGHRVDLQFADARRINRSTAHFMLAYTSDLTPTSDQIGEFFVRKFNAKITPFLSTARLYKNQKVLTVVGQLLCLTREYDDYKKMVKVIEGAVYLDVPLKETWEVSEREGNKVLVRKVKDDIIALVNARKKSMMDSYSKQTFASISEAQNISRFISILDKGDQVRALYEDRIVEGEVVSVNDGDVKIKCKAGLVTVPRGQILEVTGKNPKSAEKEDEMLEDYYAKALGDPDYAKKLVK